MDSKVLSIMFTDIKGFTERSGHSSREGMLALVKKHNDLLRPIIDHYGGQLIKTIGDAFLVVFESPTNAVLCGVLMQETLREYNSKVAGEADRIEIRISINTGEVQLSDSDVYGQPVNIASRINSIAEINEVWFTHAVYLSMNQKEVPSSEIGERRLKGVDEPVRVYKVIQDRETDIYRRVVEGFKGGERKPTPVVPAEPVAPRPTSCLRSPGSRLRSEARRI